MDFIDKVLDYAERLPEGIERTRDQIIGIINPNRRHDKPEEKLDDEIRAQINSCRPPSPSFHLEDDKVEPPYTPPPHGVCRVQAVWSVCDWSHGVLTEHSIQNAYIQLINEANHFIYIKNQFFISHTREEGPVQNQIAKALVERIIKAAKDDRKFKVIVVIPELPGFAGDIKNDSALKIIMAAQYRTMNHGGHSIYEEIRKAGFEPMDYIRFYHLRSYDRINAPQKTLISQMEENSGVSFYEAQVTLARQWEGTRTTAGDTPKEMFIRVPQPAQEGMVLSETKRRCLCQSRTMTR
ncbi:hypothetical protein C8R48DRAFT_774924 [Suillus tomentosus]|nr:hypothetical protein C8R48DRAFT_774924 [Suillus tomentosus]